MYAGTLRLCCICRRRRPPSRSATHYEFRCYFKSSLRPAPTPRRSLSVMSTPGTSQPHESDSLADAASVGLTPERLAEIQAQRASRMRKTKAELVSELESIEIEWAVMGERMQRMMNTLSPPLSGVDNETGVPAFPATFSDSPLRLTRPRRWNAWVGSGDRLVKLAEVAEGCLKSHFDQHAVSRHPPLSGFELEAYRLKVDVRGLKGQIQRSGPMRTVLGEVLPREIESVSIGNDAVLAEDRHLPTLEIRLGKIRSFDQDAIALTVSDDDSDWVASTYDKLVTEIQRNVPWWGLIRSIPGKIALFALMVAIIWGITLPLAEKGGRIANWFTIVGYSSFAVGAALVTVMQRYVFRPLEVLEPGRSTSAKRVLAGGITLLGIAGAIASIVALGR